jgi:hypothetical protein
LASCWCLTKRPESDSESQDRSRLGRRAKRENRKQLDFVDETVLHNTIIEGDADTRDGS